ncbi:MULTISPECIES: lipoprotein [unclassified Streptomyces]|uniref:lipoprotein n=1 Tax=unclassified Streptomyces TaxID=2593676 RepID=UPI0022514B28|nr:MULTISPECIES: lipoprotein [unclassified Streptomyces]MCX5053891.1 lipoprotein [Streptomyces sp. NBC_00474]
MPVGAGNTRLRLVHAALLAGVLTGCAETSGGGTRASTPATADSSGPGAKAAERGTTIGAPGSACELPVTFDIARNWKAKAVDAEAASGDGTGDSGDLGSDIAAALLRQGPVTAACEVDAKPAGNIGFLRVWTGEPGADDARTVLKAFVAAEDGASRAEYRTFTAGDLDGVEVEYQYTSELLDETKQEHALAVTTARGPVVLHLGGLDDGEHRAMLPAFELAKRTLRTA